MLLFRFHYSIVRGNGKGHFSINKVTGEVKTTVQLDREVIDKYSLVIVAEDVDLNLKCHKGRTLLSITVSDKNDNKPKFVKNPYLFSILEDHPLWAFDTVSATDADVGDNGKLRYSIKSGTGKDDFILDVNTGAIKPARALDYESRKSYDLTALVQDSGSPVLTDEANLKITIRNVNEAPTFTGACAKACSVSIDEGNVVNRAVKTLSATDPDTATPCALQFEIVSSDKHYFSIGSTSGQIRTRRSIDRELKDVYVLTVDVKDCSSPPLKDRTTVTVTALDVNDNTPSFQVSAYSATVMEEQPQGTRVTQVSASGESYGRCKETSCYMSGPWALSSDPLALESFLRPFSLGIFPWTLAYILYCIHFKCL